MVGSVRRRPQGHWSESRPGVRLPIHSVVPMINGCDGQDMFVVACTVFYSLTCCNMTSKCATGSRPLHISNEFTYRGYGMSRFESTSTVLYHGGTFIHQNARMGVKWKPHTV